MGRLRAWGSVLVGVAIGMAAAASWAADEVPAGQALFTRESCNLCHAVPSAGITAKIPSGKLKAPALPPAELPSDEWLGQFLHGEVDKDGAKHPKKFAGTDEELSTLLAWLRGMPAAP